MKTIHRQHSSAKFWVMIGVLVLTCIGVSLGFGVVVNSGLTHYVPATLAIISFGISVILSMHYKRISINSVVAFGVGLLFLASSIIELGFNMFTQNMSILDQMRFSGVMRPKEVSHGLVTIGMGIALIWTRFGTIKLKNSSGGSTQTPASKVLSVFQVCVGIFSLLFGIYSAIMGFLPLE